MWSPHKLFFSGYRYVIARKYSVNMIRKKQALAVCVVVFIVVLMLTYKPEAPVTKAILSPAMVRLSHRVMHRYAKHHNDTPLLVLFTTFRPSQAKSHIYENTLRIWSLLRPVVQPLMFYDEEFPAPWKEQLTNEGWALLPVPQYNSYGLPILRLMFKTAMEKFPAHHYGYSNGDILFDESLVLTLEALHRHPVIKDFLMVGRRINYFISPEENLLSLKDLRHLAEKEKAQMFISDAEDYFITTKHGVAWDDLPNFVVGRVGYDNWLVIHALKNGPLVIDATNTVLCFHQTWVDGVFSGSKAVKAPDMNTNLAGKNIDYTLGKTDCAQWVTAFNETLKMVVLKNRSSKYCHGYKNTYFEHQVINIPKL